MSKGPLGNSNEDKCRIFAYCVLCDWCICTLLYVTKVASRKSRTKLCRCPKLPRYPDYKAERGSKPKKRTLNISKKSFKMFCSLGPSDLSSSASENYQGIRIIKRSRIHFLPTQNLKIFQNVLLTRPFGPRSLRFPKLICFFCFV